MRVGVILAAAGFFAGHLCAADPDPREILRRCVELDQSNWQRMKNYTWGARETTRHLDGVGKVKSTESDTWETVILYGRPYRKFIEHNSVAVTAEQKRKEQEKLDKTVAAMERETAAQRESRIASYEKERTKDREFLLELPDAFNFRIDGDAKIDGRETWVISAVPKPGYRAKHGDAKAFSKIEGRIWVDKTEFQWVRIEAKTVDTISWGWCLARLNRGATLVFEQTRVNDEIWLPKRQFTSGSGRLAVLKKLTEEDEVTWTNYRKFQVASGLVSTR